MDAVTREQERRREIVRRAICCQAASCAAGVSPRRPCPQAVTWGAKADSVLTALEAFEAGRVAPPMPDNPETED